MAAPWKKFDYVKGDYVEKEKLWRSFMQLQNLEKEGSSLPFPYKIAMRPDGELFMYVEGDEDEEPVQVARQPSPKTVAVASDADADKVLDQEEASPPMAETKKTHPHPSPPIVAPEFSEEASLQQRNTGGTQFCVRGRELPRRNPIKIRIMKNLVKKEDLDRERFGTSKQIGKPGGMDVAKAEVLISGLSTITEEKENVDNEETGYKKTEPDTKVEPTSRRPNQSPSPFPSPDADPSVEKLEETAEPVKAKAGRYAMVEGLPPKFVQPPEKGAAEEGEVETQRKAPAVTEPAPREAIIQEPPDLPTYGWRKATEADIKRIHAAYGNILPGARKPVREEKPVPVAPPVLNRPVLDPPVLDPPVLDPPVLDPPVLDPPVLDPPVLDPPVLKPSTPTPDIPDLLEPFPVNITNDSTQINSNSFLVDLLAAFDMHLNADGELGPLIPGPLHHPVIPPWMQSQPEDTEQSNNNHGRVKANGKTATKSNPPNPNFPQKRFNFLPKPRSPPQNTTAVPASAPQAGAQINGAGAPPSRRFQSPGYRGRGQGQQNNKNQNQKQNNWKPRANANGGGPKPTGGSRRPRPNPAPVECRSKDNQRPFRRGNYTGQNGTAPKSQNWRQRQPVNSAKAAAANGSTPQKQADSVAVAVPSRKEEKPKVMEVAKPQSSVKIPAPAIAPIPLLAIKIPAPEPDSLSTNPNSFFPCHRGTSGTAKGGRNRIYRHKSL